MYMYTCMNVAMLIAKTIGKLRVHIHMWTNTIMPANAVTLCGYLYFLLMLSLNSLEGKQLVILFPSGGCPPKLY